MALKRLTIKNYAVLELNHVAFRRDGRIVAQCKLGKESDGVTDIEYVENGMLLAVDEMGRKVNKPSGSGVEPLVALNYTTEHMYDERHPELNNFKLERNTFLPRLGYLAAGDKFTTNCIAYDDGAYANDAALVSAINAATPAAPLYAQECTNGAIQILAAGATRPTGAVCLQVCYATTLPNGDFAVKFVSLK